MDELTTNMAEVIKCFSKINSDIFKVFNKMDKRLKGNVTPENIIIKEEKGKKSQRYKYVDDKGLLEGENSWFLLNSHIIQDRKIKGFTLYISIDEQDLDNIEDYSRYKQEFANPLEIDADAPLVAIYGVFEPNNLKKAIPTEWTDDILRFSNGWENYDKEKIRFGKWINVTINCEEDDFEGTEYSKIEWYKKAKIKIIPMAQINSSEKIEEIINEIFMVNFDY